MAPKQKIVINPAIISFDRDAEKGIDISTTCEALIRANSQVIFYFSQGVLPPLFGENLQIPNILKEWDSKRIDEVNKKFTKPGQEPAAESLQRNEIIDRELSSIMFFYRQQMIYWMCHVNNSETEGLIQDASRNERREIERRIKIPLLPIEIVRFKKSPQLLESYRNRVGLLFHLLNTKS